MKKDGDKATQGTSRKRLEKLAWYMDSSIKIPGFNARLGLDGLLGLIPGAGDTIGALISSIVISEAVRMGVPKSVLLKMAFNIALDVVVGAVPVLGDLFDFVWKANQRNVVLLSSVRLGFCSLCRSSIILMKNYKNRQLTTFLA